MPTLSHTYNVTDLIWVVDPSGPAIFHGTISSISLMEYLDNTNAIIDSTKYTILLDNERGTLVSTEEYMSVDQAGAEAILITVIDDLSC
jgi:hypothetical protein